MSRLLILLIVGLLSFNSNAESVRLVTGEFTPFTSQALPQGGMISQIVRSAFAQQNIEVNIEFRPWKRGYQETLNGLALATFPYSKNAERLEKFLYSDPILPGQVFFFTQADSKLKFGDYADIAGASLCMPLGYNLFPPVEQAVSQGLLTRIEPAAMDNCYLMVEQGRADLTIARLEIGWHQINQLLGAEHHLKTLETPIWQVTEHLIIAKASANSQHYLEKFNAGLQAIRSQGLIESIMSPYIGITVAP